MRNYSTYMLLCSDRSYYTGVTNNIEERLRQHHDGIDPTCYTFKRRPLELVHVEHFGDIDDAIAREKQLKSWSRKKKEALIQNNAFLLKHLAKKRKGEAAPDGIQVGVDVIIEGDDGTVLLIQRRDDQCWSMPGGWVEQGETPDQAAMREVKEETGLNVTLCYLADVHIRSSGTVHFTYIAQRLGGALVFQKEEVLRAEFLAPEDVLHWHADHKERVRRAIDRIVSERKSLDRPASARSLC